MCLGGGVVPGALKTTNSKSRDSCTLGPKVHDHLLASSTPFSVFARYLPVTALGWKRCFLGLWHQTSPSPGEAESRQLPHLRPSRPAQGRHVGLGLPMGGLPPPPPQHLMPCARFMGSSFPLGKPPRHGRRLSSSSQDQAQADTNAAPLVSSPALKTGCVKGKVCLLPLGVL